MPASPSRPRRSRTGSYVPTEMVVLVLLMAVAGLIGRNAGSASAGAIAPAGTWRAAHVYSVYPGPVRVGMLRTAEAWWNQSGADVQLTIAYSPGNANVVIEPFQVLGTTSDGLNEGGVTNMPCTAPCRPDATETIVLSPTNGPALELVLTHELGHAIGLAHTHTSACSVMAPVVGEHCPGLNLPTRIPAADRDELLSIWDRAPTTTNEGSGT